MNCIDLEFESSLANLKEILKSVPILLGNVFPSISEEDLSTLRLLFTELLTNAIIHGNKENPIKKVRLTISIHDTYISAKIKDDGEGFDYIKILNGKTPSLEQWEKEHGRGLILARNLADELVFNKKGNEVQFKKHIAYPNCFLNHRNIPINIKKRMGSLI